MRHIILTISSVIILTTQLIIAQEDVKQAENLIFEMKYDSALAVLENVTASEPRNKPALIKSGLVYMKLNDYDNAANRFFAALRLDSSDADVMILLASAFFEGGIFNKALSIYEELYESGNASASALNNLGNIYMHFNRYEKAAGIFRELVELKPENKQYRKNLAVAYNKAGYFPAAASELEKVIDWKEPDFKAALMLVSLYFNKLEQPDTALHHIQVLWGHYTQNPVVNRTAGEINFKMKRYTTAQYHYKTALQNGDSSTLVFQKIGLCQYHIAEEFAGQEISEEQDYLYAADYLKVAYSLDTSNSMTTLYLGVCYNKGGKPDSAVIFLEKSVELLVPDYITDVYTFLGGAYENKKEIKKSIEAYNEALHYDSKHGGAYFYLGSIYDKIYSDKERAIKYYELFIKYGEGSSGYYIDYAKKRIEALKEEEFFDGNY